MLHIMYRFHAVLCNSLYALQWKIKPCTSLNIWKCVKTVRVSQATALKPACAICNFYSAPRAPKSFLHGLAAWEDFFWWIEYKILHLKFFAIFSGILQCFISPQGNPEQFQMIFFTFWTLETVKLTFLVISVRNRIWHQTQRRTLMVRIKNITD